MAGSLALVNAFLPNNSRQPRGGERKRVRANKGNETRLSLIFDRIRCDTLIHGTELGEGEGEEINVRELQRRVEGERGGF